MGVASGVLREGVAPAASAVLELAKLISDAGAGGQILMCRSTFKAVKEIAGELGSVTEKGESREVSKLHPNAAQSSWLSWLRSVRQCFI